MQGLIVRLVSATISIMFWCMIWRGRTVSAAQGSWVEKARVESRWQACYRSEHSAWRNPAIRYIPAQGDVSGLFGHVDGSIEGIDKDLKERRG